MFGGKDRTSAVCIDSSERLRLLLGSCGLVSHCTLCVLSSLSGEFDKERIYMRREDEKRVDQWEKGKIMH